MSKRWYVVHAYSGMEKSVGVPCRSVSSAPACRSKFGKILVPTEEVVEMKNGQRTSPSAGSSRATCSSKWT
jgi:transcriptional antiterminator NusG